MRGEKRRHRPGDDYRPYESLIERAKAGQGSAVTALYENHVAMVHGYFRACGVRDADDLTSEVFVGMLRNIGHFHGDRNDFRRWLMTIAHRRMLDSWRRQRSSPVSYVDPLSLVSASGATTVEMHILSIDRDLIGAFRSLTDSQREVLALRFIADLSIDDVAAIIDRPVTAVKSLQHRGLESVKRRLSPGWTAQGA